ncbi:hypothetical protein CY789_08525 [Campylobacter coli]|nr:MULTISPECIES: hypothetical protein [Bacteria]AHK73191.1 hypothetical protein YSQ_04235 [Campylobacter coli RM1875]EAC1313273.1 hypothetical protein [Campylobacter coli]EAC1804564.1 hypothetical protein [Campylobacter coli]EAC2153477.1 hypothetical protein [Campylobacter coli]EAH4483282.1 hypothetical protein [Campylobacter coli]
MSSILNAYNEAKILQEQKPNNAVVISYLNYKGYYPKIQNIDLLIIQGALKAIQQNNTNFEDNVKLKYEK